MATDPPKIQHGPYGDDGEWAFKYDLGPGIHLTGWHVAKTEAEALEKARAEVAKWGRDGAAAVVERVEVPLRAPRRGGMDETQGHYHELLDDGREVDIPFGGACPVQGEGDVGGLEAYYRARGAHWSLTITLSEQESWTYGRPCGAWPDAGWLHRDESIANIAEAVRAFRLRVGPPSGLMESGEDGP